ncbi:MAG: class I SAM-dependent methyltransferase family protein [Halobacteria archaeon]
MSEESFLAVEVDLEYTEHVLREARELGVYDRSRSVINEGDVNHVPVTRSVQKNPGYFTYGTVVRQPDPVFRRRGLETYLPRDFPHPLPGGWSVVGDIVLVKLDGVPDEAKQRTGEALLELHPHCNSVFEDHGVSGVTREPDVEHVAGSRETETVHRENGYVFELDVAETMFSIGNAAERVRMEEVTQPEETVYDMFAGIGYFTVPAALSAEKVYAAEINPTAAEYLRRNVDHNGVGKKVEVHEGDCRQYTPTADRVVMGYFDAPEYLDHALNCLNPPGTIHVHAVIPSDGKTELQENIRSKLRSARKETGDTEIVSHEVREVKGYSEGLVHVVDDVSLE